MSRPLIDIPEAEWDAGIEAAKRTRGRPRLTEGEHPVGVRVQMPQEMRNAIDATGRKRSEFIREAVREKLARG